MQASARPQMSVRIDKWLWAARFFKTRTLAQDAVAGGRIRMNGDRVKPAKEVKQGDAIEIRIGEYEWSVQVSGLADKRGSADLARTLYAETPDSIARRAALVADRKATLSGDWAARTGRPTKRDRRETDRLRGHDE
jgi:ribosome-associated heat shock protein Hsp15